MRRYLRLAVVAPGEGRVDHDTFRDEGRAVALVERQVLILVPDSVAVERIVPLDLAGQGLGVRVDQELVGVEAVPGIGRKGAVHTIAVELTGPHVRQIAVPDFLRHLRQGDAMHLLAVGVEQAELDLAGSGREQGEIGALAVPGGTQREWPPGPQSQVSR